MYVVKGSYAEEWAIENGMNYAYLHASGKIEHTLVKTQAKAATCLAEGNAEYYTCTECGKVFADKEGSKETTLAALTTAKLSHSYTGSVKANGDGTHAYQCVNGCGKYGGAVSCVTQTVNYKEATETEAGYTGDKVCTVCGQTVSKGQVTDKLTPAHTHTLVKTEAEAATCLAEGNAEYYT